MGKRYHCDYCNKTMSASPSIIKTHIKGLVHQKLVFEHYQVFKDAETILNEESKKKPCLRYPRGECQFGYMCRFSHYSTEEINYLQEIVNSRARSNTDITQPSFEDLYKKLQHEKSKPQSFADSTVLYDRNGVTYVFPWTYNPTFDEYENVPPSLRRIQIEDFKNFNVTSWG